MQNFFTREDVLAYQQKGIKTIRVDQMPILTDLAREALQTFGMEIVTGAAAPAPRGPEKAAERPGYRSPCGRRLRLLRLYTGHRRRGRGPKAHRAQPE